MSAAELDPIEVIEVVAPDPEPVEDPTGPSMSAIPAIVDDPIDQLAMVPDLPVIAPENEFRALAMQAKMLSGSSLVPSALRGKPHDVLLILLTGRDLGIAPTAALRKCYVVDGQVTIAPAMKLALIKIQGKGCIRPPAKGDPDFPNTKTRATAIAYDNNGKEINRSTLEWDDVKDITAKGRALLVDKDNWKNYPGRMLWWRISGWLADDIWPEASFGIYSPDEIGAVTDEEGHVIDVKEVKVVDGFERKQDTPAAMIEDAVAEALTARSRALPPEGKEVLKQFFREREIQGSIFSQTAAKVKIIEPMIAAVEKRAAAGEWGDWEPIVAPVGVGEGGEVIAPDPAPIDVPDQPDATTGPTAKDVDDTWDAARLATLDLIELVKVPAPVLVDACHEWGVEITDDMSPMDLAAAFDAKSQEAF